jgi:dolichol-phosphate mannosyltransferase
MKTIDIILPVYNEEEGIAAFHGALRPVLDALSDRYRFRILYVLDRSRDNTFSILKGLAAKDPSVTVLHLSRRFGHQMSLVAGIDHSHGDALIMMDCDLQHPPAVIPQLLEKFEEGYDVVHAIRRYDPATGFWKGSTSNLFYRLQNALSPVEIEEGSADFRLISRKVAAVFQTSLREQNQFLRGLFQWVGFRSAKVIFVSPARTAGKTKYNLGRLLAFSIAGITSFSKIPLRVASIIGFLMWVVSLLHGLWLVGQFVFVGNLPRGYTSIMLLITFTGGLQLIVLGIIGEYLGSVFDEVKRRPLYIVDEEIGNPSA